MTENTNNGITPVTDDWKSSLPGVNVATPSPTTGEKRLPVPPIPKMGSSLNMAAEVAQAEEKPLPPLDKIGLSPKPPKVAVAPQAPILTPIPTTKPGIAKIPIPPAPDFKERAAPPVLDIQPPKPADDSMTAMPLPPPQVAKVTVDLQAVKTFRDDSLIAEGKIPETHNIDFNKASSDEDVNKFLKPQTLPVTPLPQNPILTTPPNPNFKMQTPTGVHNQILPPKPPTQEQPLRTGTPPIRRTVAPETFSPSSESTFDPNRFGTKEPERAYDAGITETPIPRKVDGLSKIRTLRDDVNQVVRNQNVTLASIAIKEDERRRAGAQTVKSPGMDPKIIIGIIIILLILGSGAIWFAFYRDTTPDAVVIDETAKTNDIIFTDTDEIIEVSSLETGGLSLILKTEIQKELRLGQMKNIRLVNTVKNSEGEVVLREIPSSRILFDILGLNVEDRDRLVRLLSDNYLIGIYSFTNKSSFVIFEADDYTTVFAQMLLWEGKDLTHEWHKALTGKALPKEVAGTWRDEVIENLDLRVFKSETGDPLLYWSFIDRVKTLVITTDEDTMLEVRTRFQTRSATQ